MTITRLGHRLVNLVVLGVLETDLGDHRAVPDPLLLVRVSALLVRSLIVGDGLLRPGLEDL